MEVGLVGTGYVGLVSGVCFAEIGHTVTCIDVDADKIQSLRLGHCPIYEPGLAELLASNKKAGRLSFSTSFSTLANADVVFLAVGTPSGEDGGAQLGYLYKALESVIKEAKDGSIIAVKSTVPVGTSEKLRDFIGERTDKSLIVVSNPEFLKEGSAVEDFMKPDRVVVGCRLREGASVMEELYAPLVRQGNPLLVMANASAEMTKYAANCLLASRISFINEVAHLCELTGADVQEVRRGIASDQRIGRHFLYPGPGYGGSCFPKDVAALQMTADGYGLELKVVKATQEVNDAQRLRLLDKVKRHFKGGSLKGRSFSFWGVAFKANTDDVRESAAVYFAELLLREGADIRFYDPVAGENYLRCMRGRGNNLARIAPFGDKYDCLAGASGLVVMTEWREFASPDFDRIRGALDEAVVFDARNLFDTQRVLAHGFAYYPMGKSLLPESPRN